MFIIYILDSFANIWRNNPECFRTRATGAQCCYTKGKYVIYLPIIMTLLRNSSMNMCAAYHPYIYIFVIKIRKSNIYEVILLNILYRPIYIWTVVVYCQKKKRWNELNLDTVILCFHDEPYCYQHLNGRNNCDDFVTILWKFRSFVKGPFC